MPSSSSFSSSSASASASSSSAHYPLKSGNANTEDDIEVSRSIPSTLRYRPSPSPPLTPSRVSRLLEGYPQGNLQGPQYRLTLSFHNLSYQLSSGKILLEDMSGVIQPGRFTAIMGPSGAGKTTLMRALMGKLQGIQGETRVSQVPIEMKQLERLIGYVPQEDVMLRELTAREVLYHAASIRLPRTWSSAQKRRYGDAVMEALGLGEDVADVLVGDETTRGLSGGQRKRLNIGMELVATPLALFLDEPTTGLDATVALDLSRTLREIAHLGLTVLSILHQPRPEIFHAFDDVLLLAPGGYMVFQGSVLEVVPYFTSLGFHFPSKVNPADVLMDILSATSGSPRSSWRGSGRFSVATLLSTLSSRPPPSPHAVAMTKRWQEMSEERGATRLQQTWLCVCRALLQQYRRPRTLIFEYGVAAVAGTLLGIAVMHWKGEFYIGVLREPYTAISASPRTGTMPEMCLFITASVAISGCPAAVLTFGEEKPVYWREAGSGHSRTSYFLGKVLSTLPRLLLGSLHYTALFHLLAHSPLPLSDLYPLVLLQYFCVYGASEAISLAFSRSNGTLIASIATLIIAVFNGYGPSYDDAGNWGLSWFWDMSYTRWFTEAFITAYTSPYRDLYDVEGSTAIFGYTLDRYILDICLPLVIGLILRVIGFLSLVGLNRDKQK
ncbi:P-loop containing nucleoside triphosphate hydrolase protein [Piptocephalis cylindrospora]|uniref:P-loop containing nucleoside triphosphate hydrolase protein n=1 Tax=Piptocephalis cylindrospora TaxID=1907219 RepID=A0A4P9Y289_9FUNG|nr:P-loop containing nucleoside triphosphate hydrolase protein [Piptocephalis cylindrospora]|eukprot:RKP12996.1 P-loop containing nucleoside triphosphate hydrolase protein [Piptocephalis cylindrospora]